MRQYFDNLFNLEGGGAWEKENVEDEDRIRILPNLLTFVGTTVSRDNFHDWSVCHQFWMQVGKSASSERCKMLWYYLIQVH